MVAPLAFFEREGKEFFDPIKLGEGALGKSPKGFDAVDVNATGSECLGLVAANVFVVAAIGEAGPNCQIIQLNEMGERRKAGNFFRDRLHSQRLFR